MTSTTETLLALDVGGRRIGVARADTSVKIAQPIDTVLVDGTELDVIEKWIKDVQPSRIVVGYPRNQSGEPTGQTASVEQFAERLKNLGVPLVFQDESLTSVIAEQRLKERGKNYAKAAIDAEAAAIILQDYLELQYGY